MTHLTSLYMPKDRVLKIETDKKLVERLYRHKDAVSMIQVKELSDANSNFKTLIKLMIRLGERTNKKELTELLSEVYSNLI